MPSFFSSTILFVGTVLCSKFSLALRAMKEEIVHKQQDTPVSQSCDNDVQHASSYTKVIKFYF